MMKDNKEISEKYNKALSNTFFMKGQKGFPSLKCLTHILQR